MPGFTRQREGSLFRFVCPAEAPADHPDPGKRSSLKKTHTCADVRPGPKVGPDWPLRSATAQGREGAHKSGLRLGTSPISPAFLIQAARLSLAGVKAFCPWLIRDCPKPNSACPPKL